MVTAIVIIVLLGLMVTDLAQRLRERSEKVRCAANLRGLYIAANSHLLEQGKWPQISPSLIQNGGTEYARMWIDALQPYGIQQQNWICPGVQRNLGSPDLHDPKNVRIDYLASPFGEHPSLPYRWMNQPWFLERGAVHEGGPQLVYANGEVVSMTEAMRRVPPSQ